MNVFVLDKLPKGKKPKPRPPLLTVPLKKSP